jgi:hypothetical protein
LIAKTFLLNQKIMKMLEMAIARTNNSLIQKNYALSVILKVKTEEISSIGRGEEEKSSIDSLIGARRISEEISFIICQSCFWCASYINTITAFTARRRGDAPPTKCPVCIEGNIESMSINKNEVYKFDYDAKHGVVLEFLK